MLIAGFGPVIGRDARRFRRKVLRGQETPFFWPLFWALRPFFRPLRPFFWSLRPS
jgi:hypothetical protein